MFNTNNIEIVKCCQQEFCFSLPSVTLARRTEFFKGKIRQCENNFLTLPAIDVFILTRVSIRVSDCRYVLTAMFHRLFVS